MALCELVKREQAIEKFTKAIDEYQIVLVDKKIGYAGPLLAWAYKERGKVWAERAGTSEQAVTDFDKAIAILEKSSKEKGSENTFGKMLDDLRTRRARAKSRE